MKNLKKPKIYKNFIKFIHIKINKKINPYFIRMYKLQQTFIIVKVTKNTKIRKIAKFLVKNTIYKYVKK